MGMRSLNRRYGPLADHLHSVVLAHLLERLDERAEHQDQLVLVIADEVDEAAAYRRDLWRFQRFATAGYKPRQLKRIVDTIHFAPSKASRLVQSADLVAYLYRRMHARQDSDERAQRANAALWGRINSKVMHRHCWHP